MVWTEEFLRYISVLHGTVTLYFTVTPMENIVSILLMYARTIVDGQYCPPHFSSSSSPATPTPGDVDRATFYESQLWPPAKDSAIVRLSCVGTRLSDVADFIRVRMTSGKRALSASSGRDE